MNIKIIKNVFWSSIFLILFACSLKNPAGAYLVVLNANILTVDDKEPKAEAIVVKNGIIQYVGSNKVARKFIHDDTKVIDAKGKTIVPGFFDAHLHPEEIYPALHRLGKVDLGPDSVKKY